MMHTLPTEDALKESMETLESALITPLVPGELAGWTRTVEKAADRLGTNLNDYILTVLHDRYAEIAKTDPEMYTQVEKLIGEDKHLLEQYEVFRQDVARLVERVPEVKSDEKKTDDLRARIEKLGTDLILHIKKQQAATSTWLSEAVYRDRGPVD